MFLIDHDTIYMYLPTSDIMSITTCLYIPLPHPTSTSTHSLLGLSVTYPFGQVEQELLLPLLQGEYFHQQRPHLILPPHTLCNAIQAQLQ